MAPKFDRTGLASVLQSAPTPLSADGPRGLPQTVLDSYRILPGRNIFTVGTFDKAITVTSQQKRALNIVWAICEILSSSAGQGQKSNLRVAIVGGGFAGMTAAAAFIKKVAPVDVTIFEKRDAVMPLQAGSDSRWLHPHIYDWPNEGSIASSAGLPVLNWTAGRASDVVAQTLDAWSNLLASSQNQAVSPPRMYCATRYLQLSVPNGVKHGVKVEWVGDRRVPHRPSLSVPDASKEEGGKESFDAVILCSGFGLEVSTPFSYWRNETLSQPVLGLETNSYIVSGSGDGAIVDLLRLRIANYRQDRILAELFRNTGNLIVQLRALILNCGGAEYVGFDELEELANSEGSREEFTKVLNLLNERLRNDTSVILHIRHKNFSNLFEGKRVSFQNRFLAFLLFKCGGFYPSRSSLDQLSEEHAVPKERVIIRHGTQTHENLRSMFSGQLGDEVGELLNAGEEKTRQLRQADSAHWSSGYFDMVFNVADAGEAERARWRQEYLPSPTRIAVTSMCASIASFLVANLRSKESRLRVTFHRGVQFDGDIVFQQCADYYGNRLEDELGAAGRALPQTVGIIGEACRTKRVVRSRRGVTNAALRATMRKSDPKHLAQRMSERARSLLAIPVLGYEDRVLGVLFVDSQDPAIFKDIRKVALVAEMCRASLSAASAQISTQGRIANPAFSPGPSTATTHPTPLGDSGAYEVLDDAQLSAPRIPNLRHFNLDFSDFADPEESYARS